MGLMRPPTLRLHNEIVVDCFAGGGGTSLGIEMALGRSPDVAINHNGDAISMHQRNHPLPFPTICAKGTHLGEVRAFLTRYNGTGGPESLQLPLGTITTKPRWNIVHVAGEDYEVADIGMRMLVPRELFRGQSFPDSYVIDVGHDGRVFTLETQVLLCGNSVSPLNAAALVDANCAGQRAEVA